MSRLFRMRVGFVARSTLLLLVSVIVGLAFPSGATLAQVGSTRLALTLAPDSLPAGSGTHEAILIQILGDDGRPRVSEEPQVAQLVSSRPSIANVQSTVSISPGRSFGTAFVTVGNEAGSASIEVWLDGVFQDELEIVVTSPSSGSRPVQLRLDLAPGSVAVGHQVAGYVTVSIVDADGRLTEADRNYEVVLRSSEPSIISVPSSVVLPKGKSLATVGLHAKEQGVSVLSAISQDLEPAFGEISANQPVLTPTSIRLWPVARTFAETNAALGFLLVQATDDQGLPAAFPCGQINLSSSRQAVVSIPAVETVLECGSESFVRVPMMSGEVGGTTIISAVTDELEPSTTNVRLQSPKPLGLGATAFPEQILPSDRAASSIVVQLLDASGSPVKASIDTYVELIAAGTNEPLSIEIPKDRSYTRVPIPNVDPGTTQFWAVADGLASSLLAVTLDEPLMDLRLTSPSGVWFPGDEIPVEVLASVDGLPMPGVEIFWRYTGGVILTADSTTSESGVARAIVRAENAGDGKLFVEGVKADIASDSQIATLSVVAATAMAPPKGPTLFGIPTWVFLLAAIVALGGVAAAHFATSATIVRIQFWAKRWRRNRFNSPVS